MRPWAAAISAKLPHNALRYGRIYNPPLSVSKKYFRPAVRILKLSKSFKILLIERAVGFLPPAHTPRCSVPDIFCEVFLTVSGADI